MKNIKVAIRGAPWAMAAMAAMAFGGASSAWAQSPSGIYTCVDSQGRKLTSDRPIPECMDREQRLLNPSGTVKQKLGPNPTAAERAQQEARDKQELEERNRVLEERRRDKALMARFPNRAALDQARADAIAQAQGVSETASARLKELATQRKALDDEMEFYRKDPSKAPQNLQRQVNEHNQNVAAQKRFILDQEEEARRINAHFDADLLRLQKLWPTLK